MNNIMIDIETLGNKSNSVITSIGAVMFDMETGETGNEFYKRIDIDSCLDNGLTVNGDTIKWWLSQNELARSEITKDGEDLLSVLYDFSRFIKSIKNPIVWSNGLRFDISLIEDAYNKVSLSVPWQFRNERDVRTLVSFAPQVKSETVNTWNETLHHAIQDCKLQIKYCTKIYKKLKI